MVQGVLENTEVWEGMTVEAAPMVQEDQDLVQIIGKDLSFVEGQDQIFEEDRDLVDQGVPGVPEVPEVLAGLVDLVDLENQVGI